MMTEALPVAVTPSMRAGLGWTDGIIGQLVTAYAVGCGLAAIPMTALTRSVNRKTLLLTTLLAFVVTNSVPLVSSDLMILTVARFAAGACAGLLWAMLAGYATRLVVPGIAGRAMAIAMAGTPMALALGIPFGSLLGSMLGWRLSFAAVSALAALVLLLAIASLPRIPGEPRGGERPGLGSVLTLPGLGRVLAVTAFYSTAHNVVYTFLPALTQGRKDLRLDVLLLAFGLVAVIGLALVGKHVDRHLQLLATLVCAGLVACLAACFLVPAGPLFAVLGVVAVWGMAFGGAPRSSRPPRLASADSPRRSVRPWWSPPGTSASRWPAPSAECSWTPARPRRCPGWARRSRSWPPSARSGLLLLAPDHTPFPATDGHTEPVPGGRQRAGVEVREPARRHEGLVEVELQLAVLRDVELEEATGRVGLGTRGGIGEDDDEHPAVEEARELVLLATQGEPHAAGHLLERAAVAATAELPRHRVHLGIADEAGRDHQLGVVVVAVDALELGATRGGGS